MLWANWWRHATGSYEGERSCYCQPNTAEVGDATVDGLIFGHHDTGRDQLANAAYHLGCAFEHLAALTWFVWRWLPQWWVHRRRRQLLAAGDLHELELLEDRCCAPTVRSMDHEEARIERARMEWTVAHHPSAGPPEGDPT